MQPRRAVGTRFLVTAIVAALAVVVPICAPLPATAATDPFTVSGRLIDQSATAMVEHTRFTVSLMRPGEHFPVVTAQSYGGVFTVTAPEPGDYTVYARPTPMAEPSSWAGAWYGDTQFPWHASEITLDGETAIPDLTITIPEGGSISGELSSPPVGLVYGLTADAFLLDPATGWYHHISGTMQDFSQPYTLYGLPPGDYAIRFGHNGGNGNEQNRMFPSEFYSDARYPYDATLVNLPLGGAVAGVDGALDHWSFDVVRTAGADRYETAVRISEGAFDEGVSTVYIANGSAWADALSAAPAAAHRGGPLLLAAFDHVPTVVMNEIARLQPDEVVIVGGTAVVSNAVPATLRVAGYSVRRVAGNDRYDTSRRLALDAFGEGPSVDVAWLATGHGFADALSAASDASRIDMPLILIDGASSSVDAASLAAFEELGATQFYIAGGPVAVSDRFFSSVSSAYDGWVTRFAGADRYETSRIIAEQFSSRAPMVNTGRAFVASGLGFADALAAAPVAGMTDSPLFLTPGHCVPRASLDSMIELDAFHVELVGGPAVLGEGVEDLVWC